MLGRRALLGGIVGWGGTVSASAEPIAFADEWRAFKSRFLAADGRIVDNGNGGVSHSEGQGWGLLFAVTAQDRTSFDLILNWTSRALRRPADSLHAWRYVPGSHPPVQDLNNALDGDLFIAAALARAGRSWGRPDCLQAAAAIGRDILRLLQRQVGPFTVLLPGIKGFESRDGVIINPSYYAFPMMTEIAPIVSPKQWDRLQRDGRTLLERGRFGTWSLPPDWLRVGTADMALSPAPGWPPRFSYDAVRVPLWWIWQKLPVGPAIRSIERFWSASPPGAAPAWIDLDTDTPSPYAATAGMAAVMRLTRIATGADDTAPQTVANATTYYDAALILLTHIAEREFMSQ